MDNTHVIALVLSSSLLSALLTQGIAWAREAWIAYTKKKAHAAYLAMRLAVLLEAYADACADLIQKNGSAETPPNEQYPAWSVKLPTLAEYPDDAEGWRAIDVELASRALALRNRIAGSQSVINVTIEYTEYELEEELDEQAGERGIEAYQLAVDFRRKYELEPANLIYDFTDTLIGAVSGAKKRKEERSKRNAEMMAQWPTQ